MLILHELDKHSNRMQYIQRKRQMLENLVKRPVCNVNERNDFMKWKDIIEKLEIIEIRNFRKKVGL